MRKVSILFTRVDSIYRLLPGTDCFDRRRDARTFRGGPVVAHPPCRAWGTLRTVANPRPGERWLAVWAVLQVRRHGGVLEHPKRSRLWGRMGIPSPGEPPDRWGGFTIELDQFHYGHRAAKPTWIYVVGNPLVWCDPVRRGEPEFCITQGHGVRVGHPRFKSRVTDREREATPRELAETLVRMARQCYPLA